MLYYMIFAFALFTLLMVPAFIFYANGDAYKNVGNQESLAYAPRMIGALGYSEYTCQSIPVAIDTMTLSCDYGKIGEATIFGVNPETARGSCMINDNNDDCKITNTAFAASIAKSVGN